MKQFLQSLGLSDPVLIAGDASLRVYYRVKYNGGYAIVMDAEAGPELEDFIRIGGWLRDAGVRAPQIIEADTDRGFLLLEDFGDVSFKAAMEAGGNPVELYSLAVDILLHLKNADCSSLGLPEYQGSRVHAGRVRVVDTYMPEVCGVPVNDEMIAEYLAIWGRIERRLAPCPMGFVHIDYHVENLMWLPDADGLARAGVIDYQGAVYGPLAYDLANLLEDARVDVSDDVRSAMLDRYCDAMNADERAGFMESYYVLVAQFHCRLMGQFVRLARDDGKLQYLEYLPRVAANLRRALGQPILSELNDWFIAQGVDFKSQIDLNSVM